jgi:hypothetical protein
MAKEHRGKKPRKDSTATVTMAIAKVIAKAWQSDEFKRRLAATPEKVLAEEGVQVPPGPRVEVVLDDEHVRHFVVPLKPEGLGGGEGERQGIGWCSHMWCTEGP